MRQWISSLVYLYFMQFSLCSVTADLDPVDLELLEMQVTKLEGLVSNLTEIISSEYEECQCNETLSSIKAQLSLHGISLDNSSRDDIVEHTTSPVDEEYWREQTKTKYEDCQNIYRDGFQESGVYQIWMVDLFNLYPIYCDMNVGENKGWMTFFRRYDGSTSFSQDQATYDVGFGIPTQEFWIGNENLYALARNEFSSRDDTARLRVDLADESGEKFYAEYAHFSLGTRKQGYQITDVSGYSGDAGDGLSQFLNNRFIVCGSFGGWWWDSCGNSLSSLNGNISELVWPGSPKRYRSASMKIQRFPKST